MDVDFSRSNNFNMRRFYLAYPKIQTLSGKLTWSHYCELLGIEDDNKRSRRFWLVSKRVEKTKQKFWN
ncbi:MAG TPA: DUF1016 domain-containing protein [Tissierellia bacterium]|nr:DUF1016 domain-containing protein [Tissierellia bacterium]